MADDKKNTGDVSEDGKKKKKPSGSKNNYEKISKQLQSELLSFIETYKQTGAKIPQNRNELIALFLQETKKNNLTLSEKYENYLLNISGKDRIEEVAFKDLGDLPISISAGLANLHDYHLEADKQEIVFTLWETHYRKAIQKTGNKQLIAKWSDLMKNNFSPQQKKKLINKSKLITSLHDNFSSFFKSKEVASHQKTIANYLGDNHHRPTVKTYLNAFEKAGYEIKNNSVKSAILHDQKKGGKKSVGVSSLDRSLATLTHLSLLEKGLLTREAKEMLIEKLDSTISHTTLTKHIFKGYERERFVKEQKAFSIYGSILEKNLKNTKSSEDHELYIQQYNNDINSAYHSRVLSEVEKSIEKTPQQQLLIELNELSMLNGTAFEKQAKKLTGAISTYLSEDYLDSKIDRTIIQAQFDKFGIDKKHFPNYMNFWKQIYTLDQKKATFSLPGQKDFSLVFSEKKLIIHPEKFDSIDQLDNLFSFERTIDFTKSDKAFGSLFGPTPQWYLTDDKTGTIIDNIDEKSDLDIFIGDTDLSNRLILNKKSEIEIYDTRSGKTWKGYPTTIDPSEDESQDENDLQPAHTEFLVLTNKKGEVLIDAPQIDLHVLQGKKGQESRRVLQSPLSETYHITSTTRTFVTPKEPHIMVNLLQNALFNKMLPEERRIPIQEIDTQKDELEEKFFPSQPALPEQKKETDETSKESQFSGFTFSKSTDIPQEAKEYAAALGNKPDQIKAWLAKGSIHLHVDYFTKKYGFKNIEHRITPEGNKKIIFTLTDGTEKTVREVYGTHKACIQEMISAKTHEIAHRLFHFHDIDTIPVSSLDGSQVSIPQEILAKIADGLSIVPIQDELTKTWYIEIEEGGKKHAVNLDTLEKRIATFIPGFSRKKIRGLDLKQLTDYEAAYDKFSDFTVTNTATQPPNTPTQQGLMTGRNALIKQLKTRKQLIEKHYDPTNNDHISQLSSLDEHLNKLNRQGTLLQNTTTPPVQTELDTMQQEHIAASQFLKQHTPPVITRQNQQTKNQQITQPLENPYIRSSETEKTFNFDKEFAKLNGDNDAEALTGTTLFFKENPTTLPGDGLNRVKYEIIHSTETEFTLKMKDATEKNVASSTTITIRKDKDSFDRLSAIGKNDIYKFKPQKKSTLAKDIGSLCKGGWEHVSSDFEKSYDHKGEKKTGKVTHVGIIKEKIVDVEKTKSEIYKIEWGIGSVTVSTSVPGVIQDSNGKQKQGEKLWTKKMDLDTFKMFCYTKGLHPFTEEEVKRSGKKLDPSKVPRSEIPRKDKLISLGALRKGLKSIPEAIKKKFEEDMELQEVYAKDRLSKIIPNTTFMNLDEVKGDLSGTDGPIRQRIQKYKGERSGGGEKSDVHDKPISESIRDAIFKEISTSRKYRYKAASALLYSLEKGSAYFRELAPYANKDGGGYRIKCILGPTAHKAFIDARQVKIDIYKSKGGNDDKLQDEIVKFELDFLARATTDHPFWGSKFGREIEEHRDKLYNGADSIDPSGVAKKGNFKYMFEAFMGGGVSGNNPKVLFSAIKAMESAVEDSDDFSMFYMCVLMIFANGMVHMLPKDYLDRLKGIGRSKGIPAALLAGDAYASGKVMRLLEHITTNAGQTSFTKYIDKDLGFFESRHVHNYAEEFGDGNAWKKLSGNFNEWWQISGKTVMDAFNYRNPYLLNMDNNTPPKTQEVVSKYLGEEGVFNTYKGIQGDEYIRNIDGQNPFYENNLLNVSEGTFRSAMMQGLRANQQMGEHTYTLWANFSQILDQFKVSLNSITNPKAKENMVNLLHTKFTRFFSNDLETSEGYGKDKTYKQRFNASLQGQDSLEDVIKTSIFKEKTRDQRGEEVIFQESISVPIVKTTIMKFAKIVQEGYTSLPESAFKSQMLN